MRVLKGIIFSFLVMTSVGILSQSACAESPAGAKYKIDIKFPSSMHWQLKDNQQDATGYMQTYLPRDSHSKTSQSVNFNYGKDIKTSLKDSMREVLNVMSGTDCKVKTSKILKQVDNYLVFDTFLDKCSNGKSLQQVFKVFNMPDGQYSVIYVADPHKVTSTTFKTMQVVVVNAKMVHA